MSSFLVNSVQMLLIDVSTRNTVVIVTHNKLKEYQEILIQSEAELM